MKRIAVGLCGLLLGAGGFWVPAAQAAQPITGDEAVAEAAGGGPRAGVAERFSLSFPSAPLQTVLDYIAAHAPGRTNIVIRAMSRAEVLELQQMKISANRIAGVTWETALDYLADRYNFIVNKERLPDGVVYFDKVPRVTETFLGTRFGEAVSAIARRGNANIVFSPKVAVDTPVTLSFTNVPWRDALESLLKAHECTALSEGGGRILRVATMAEADVQYETVTRQLRYVQPGGPHFRAGIVQSDKSEFIARNSGSGGSDTLSKSLIAALELVKSPSYPDRPNSGGRVTFESRTNTLIICDTPVKIKEMLKLVDEIDRPPDQVHIKTRILTSRKSPKDYAGVEWTNSTGKPGLGGSFGMGGSTDGWTNGSREAGFYQFGKLNFTQLNATMRWAETDEDVEISQTPEILVLDNEEASVFIGSINRYLLPKTNTDPNSGAVTTETEEKEMLVGVQLFVIPHICAGTDQLILEILPREEEAPNMDTQTFGSDLSVTYPKDNFAKYVHTKMMLKSGETGVIAGLINHRQKTEKTGVPVLSRIPVIRHAFNSRSNEKEISQTSILVTPTIIQASHDTDFQTQVDRLRVEMSKFEERPALMPASSFPGGAARVGRITGNGAGPIACR